MTAILNQIIEILIAGITGIAGGIGSGLTTLAQSIFLGGYPFGFRRPCSCIRRYFTCDWSLPLGCRLDNISRLS